jgi:hypothetical protein
MRIMKPSEVPSADRVAYVIARENAGLAIHWSEIDDANVVLSDSGISGKIWRVKRKPCRADRRRGHHLLRRRRQL